MSLTAPPTAPARTMTQEAFDAAVAAHISWLTTHVSEVNTLIGTLSALAAGSAMSIPYTFSTTTTDSDPGAGYLRLDNATQNTATTIRADLVGADGATWTSVIDTFDDSTSTIKGFIMLQKVSDATKWLVFSVSALASPSGYKNITVANVASSAASPFANNDSLVLKFSRTGDAGATGPTGPSFKPGMAANRYYSYPFISTTTNATLTADRLYALPIYISESCTVTKIGVEQTTGNAGNCRLGIYNMDGDALPSSLVLDAGTVTTNSSAEKEISISQALTTGWYYLAAVFDTGGAAATTRNINAVNNGHFVLGAATAAQVTAAFGPYVAHTYGSLPSTFGTATLAAMTSGGHPILWVRI